MSFFEAAVLWLILGGIVLVGLLVVAAFTVPIKVKSLRRLPDVIPFTVHYSDSQAFAAGRYEINLQNQTLTRLGD